MFWCGFMRVYVVILRKCRSEKVSQYVVWQVWQYLIDNCSKFKFEFEFRLIIYNINIKKSMFWCDLMRVLCGFIIYMVLCKLSKCPENKRGKNVGNSHVWNSHEWNSHEWNSHEWKSDKITFFLKKKKITNSRGAKSRGGRKKGIRRPVLMAQHWTVGDSRFAVNGNMGREREKEREGEKWNTRMRKTWEHDSETEWEKRENNMRAWFWDWVRKLKPYNMRAWFWDWVRKTWE